MNKLPQWYARATLVLYVWVGYLEWEKGGYITATMLLIIGLLLATDGGEV
jgi:hypothetical protein